MTVTIIILSILICLVTYFILNEKINKIKKEYIKSDLISEMKEIITFFNQEADRNISLLEEKIKQIDNKIKKFERLNKSIIEKKSKNQNTLEDSENISTSEKKLIKERLNDLNRINQDDFILQDSIRNSLDDDIDKKSINKNNKKIDKSEKIWQEKAYGMFSNGFSYEEIANKLNKNIGEIQFAISYIDMKKRIKINDDE